MVILHHPFLMKVFCMHIHINAELGVMSSDNVHLAIDSVRLCDILGSSRPGCARE